jgi:hypothetical protein
LSGSEKTSDTALRVTRRALELAFAPAYQASTMVRRRPERRDRHDDPHDRQRRSKLVPEGVLGDEA